MTPEERKAYNAALREIEFCRRADGTALNLRGIGLTRIPPEIGQLTNLRELWLQSNQLSTLPAEIGHLSRLTSLYLSENELSTLPPEIGHLRNLKVLHLFSNNLSTLPLEVGRLTALTHLFLHNNPLLAFPPNELGPDWRECNRFYFPPDPKPPSEILDYYFSIRGAEGRALREVKIILVGRGEVGKSSMVDALLGKEFVENRPRTDGIAITAWPVQLKDGGAELSLWDFGGQEIMHGTHQFFMTHRSLYVVIVDGRHDRGKQDAEYWLKLARAFGGDSPVLVVMNRQRSTPFDIDREMIAKKYGVKLEHFFRTDCDTPATIEPARDAILEQAEIMLAAEERFPIRCWEVKTRLAAMEQNGEDYLSDECYQNLCVKHGVKNPEEQLKLLRRLADLGTVVSFPDDVRLSELSVLNPEWATDGIYRVVTDDNLRENRHGLLTRENLRELLPKERWPKPLHVRYVMDLMVKFDLCFPVDGDDEKMLVPELLPDHTPPEGDWKPAECVVFQYRYVILPHGLLPRFITRTHHLSEGWERWRSGTVMADDGAEARIQADYDAGTLTVWVRGKYADSRRALLNVIRSNFESIHARIEGLDPEEMVAVPGFPEVLVSYRDVIFGRKAKEEILHCNGGQRASGLANR